jgi:predicted dehydrogenase
MSICLTSILSLKGNDAMTQAKSRSHISTALSRSSPRIALIGCGAIAEGYYLPSLAKHPRTLENLILVDQCKERLQKLSATFGVKRCLADYREVLGEADGVIIALPTHLHHSISMDFLSRGVPVLCEKPLAECADKATEMVEQARKTGVPLAVNYLQRLIPSFAKVKELLTEKKLGEPLSIKYFVGEIFDWPTISGFYFNSTISSGGVLRDRGAHVFDHICWWLGDKPKLVSSKNDSFGGREAVAYVQFEHQKCVGEVKLSWLASFPCRFMVECERGTIEGDVYDYQSILLKRGVGENQRINFKSRDRTKADIAYKVVTNFINVVKKNELPLVSGSDVLDSVRFVDECYQAATRFDMSWYTIQE